MAMRVCIVYDCLDPYTVGGHERWLRQLAEFLAADGHEVTYVTRRQWDDAEPPDIPGVRVVAVSRREDLYDANGNRHPAQAVRFGIGVGLFFARHRRDFDVIHTCAFPYFQLPALRLALAFSRVPITVDWPEVWSRAYWRRYSGLVSGTIGELIQWLCVRLTPLAVVTSKTHGDRLIGLGLRRPPVRPGGLGPDPAEITPRLEVDPSTATTVVFAGRHIREKRPELVVTATEAARQSVPGLRAVVLGAGPETDAVRAVIDARSAGDWASLPGFVPRADVETALREAAVMLLPSEREGFGIVVLESAAYGTPVVVVAGPDNAATELVVPGVNGYVAASAEAGVVAAALVCAVEGGAALRKSTAGWYAEAALQLASSATAAAMEQLFTDLVAAAI